MKGDIDFKEGGQVEFTGLGEVFGFPEEGLEGIPVGGMPAGGKEFAQTVAFDDLAQFRQFITLAGVEGNGFPLAPVFLAQQTKGGEGEKGLAHGGLGTADFPGKGAFAEPLTGAEFSRGNFFNEVAADLLIPGTTDGLWSLIIVLLDGPAKPSPGTRTLEDPGGFKVLQGLADGGPADSAKGGQFQFRRYRVTGGHPFRPVEDPGHHRSHQGRWLIPL